MAFELSRPVNLLVIHHSVSPNETTVAEIRRWHLEKGWADIGYHWVIDGSGVLVPGRALKQPGAHVAGHNTHSFGLCVTGDNTVEGRKWTAQQAMTLATFLGWFRVFFPLAEVVGHRDLHGAKTLCPGVDIRAWMRERGLK